jgi:hypothetical protein
MAMSAPAMARRAPVSKTLCGIGWGAAAALLHAQRPSLERALATAIPALAAFVAPACLCECVVVSRVAVGSSTAAAAQVGAAVFVLHNGRGSVLPAAEHHAFGNGDQSVHLALGENML